MTVIAWDGKNLVADKQATDSCGLKGTVTKIERFDFHYEDETVEEVLVGVCGDFCTSAALLQWFKDGANPKEFPPLDPDRRASLVAISKEQGIRLYTAGPYPMLFEDKTGAWGSGRDFALAAMHLGHDALKAVEVACLFNVDCGNGTDVLGFSDIRSTDTKH